MGKISVETCHIEGLKVITPQVFGDARGYFMETYNYNDYKEAGIDQVFGTVITREYPATWKKGDEPYYPINDEKNGALYAQYTELAKKEANVLFGGRLGQYKYYDMDKVIRSALDMVKEELAR